MAVIENCMQWDEDEEREEKEEEEEEENVDGDEYLDAVDAGRDSILAPDSYGSIFIFFDKLFVTLSLRGPLFTFESTLLRDEESE